MTETAVAEPTVGATEPAVGTAAEPAEVSLGCAQPAVTAGAEVTEATFGTPADLPAEVRADTLVPVLAEATEIAEIAELTRSADQFGGRPVRQWAAEQAVTGGGWATGVVVAGLVRRDDVGRGDVVRSRGGVVRRGGVIGRCGVVRRDVVVRQRMRRAAEEQGRLGQPWVECGRPPVGAGLDAEGAEFGDLCGGQAESSRDLLGVAVEFGTEAGVDSQAGEGSTVCVVGHGSVSVGLRALMPIAAEPRIPPGRRHMPFPAIPADTCRRRYRALA
ncbi:hypothetical protein ACWC0C_35420 [Streptomyces sp. NPDC001709]